MKTLHDRYLAALIAQGGTVVSIPGSKHTKITREAQGGGSFFFLGRAGSLRVGSNFSTSRVVSDSFKAKLLGNVLGG